MSNFVGNKPTPLSILLSGAKKIFTKPQKTTGTEVKNFVNVAKNLKKKRQIQDDIVKTRDEIHKNYKISNENKVKLRTKANQPQINKKMADILDKKAKGGRVGLKRGTGLGGKSNVAKIKKTFGPKSLGMQSVIYGLDKNKNITAADPKAKFIAAAKKKKKKKVI